MPAEWQIRQYALAMTEPLPGGNEIWLTGRSTLTLAHFGTELLTASFAAGSELTVRGHARPAASTIPSKTGTAEIRTKLRRLVFMMFPFNHQAACTDTDSITFRMKPAPFQLA